jgi:hypothetical protein
MNTLPESPSARRIRQLRELSTQLEEYQGLVAAAENAAHDAVFRQPIRARFLRAARDQQTKISALTEAIYR